VRHWSGGCCCGRGWEAPPFRFLYGTALDARHRLSTGRDKLFQSRIFQPSPPVATVVPSGLNETAPIHLAWPVSGGPSVGAEAIPVARVRVANAQGYCRGPNMAPRRWMRSSIDRLGNRKSSTFSNSTSM
jgi:hypothetical protein